MGTLSVNAEESENVASAPPICLAFSGAGLHGFYFNGICHYINEQNIQVKEAWGSSAGALAALSVLTRVGSEGYEAMFRAYDQHSHHIPWMFWHGRDFAWDAPDGGARQFLPKGRESESAWLQSVVNGRLHIVVTKLMGLRLERVVVNRWSSVDDLIGCLRATMTIPGITAAWPYRWRGALWIDGGFVDQHPSTENSVLVSTSLPIQPWAPSWNRHVDIFRHLPIRLAWWHSPIPERRDMFNLGYMDAKTYFETEPIDQKLQPIRSRARALRFILKIALEIGQGSFVLALMVSFVKRRSFWHSLVSSRQEEYRAGRPIELLSLMVRRCFGSAKSSTSMPRWSARLGVLLEMGTLAAASILIWFVAMDLRLDLSHHLLDIARARLRLPRVASSIKAKSPSTQRSDHLIRRPRSQPARGRHA